LKISAEGRDEEENEPCQRTNVGETEVVKKDIKRRKKTSEECSFLIIEEINQGFIWGQECVFNVPIACVHPAKNAKINHRVLNLERAK
jgi:hypothetical protein